MANIIQQFKDADGNNIYPIAYAQGGAKMDLLWTNPSPSSDFAAQTVSLDLSEYNLILIKFLSGTWGYEELLCHPSGDLYLANHTVFNLSGTTGPQYVYRKFTVNANSIVFEDTQYQYGGGLVTDNSSFKPIKIYGIKMSYIVPTEVHGIQYVEV